MKKALAWLAWHFGGPGMTVEAASRRLYKETDCGAWLKVTPTRQGGKRMEGDKQVFLCGTRAVVERKGKYFTVCATCRSPQSGGTRQVDKEAACKAAVKMSAHPCAGCGAS